MRSILRASLWLGVLFLLACYNLWSPLLTDNPACQSDPSACGAGSTDGGVIDGGDVGVPDSGPRPFAHPYASSDWRWDHPTPQGNHLRGIWGTGPDQIWAVGDAGTILLWDGKAKAWSIQASNVSEHLRAIWGSDGSNVFSVGTSGRILRFDGKSWAAMTSGTTRDLWGVWGTDPKNIYAVGAEGTILRFDGTKWSAQNSGTTRWLAGVWGADENNVFASESCGA